MALPLEVSLDAGARVSLHQHDDDRLRVTVHRSVDASQLETVLEGCGWFEEDAAGERKPLPRLRLRDGMAVVRALVDDFVSAVAFLTDVPISLSRPPFEDAWVAETDEEAELLRRLGTDQPLYNTSVQTSIRTFNAVIDDQAVLSLLGPRAGCATVRGRARADTCRGSVPRTLARPGVGVRADRRQTSGLLGGLPASQADRIHSRGARGPSDGTRASEPCASPGGLGGSRSLLTPSESAAALSRG